MMNEFPRVNWDEAVAWAALVAAFYKRNGRDPHGEEYDYLLPVAREMAAHGFSVLH